MSYIWEEYSEKKTYHVGELICPYIEVLDNKDTFINVNPLIRFSNIFNASLDEQYIVSTDKKNNDNFALDVLKLRIGENGVRQIENVLFHFLAQLDKIKGLNHEQQAIEKLRGEIETGKWGKQIKELFNAMNNKDRDIIVYVLYQRINNDNQSFFMEAIGKIYDNSSLCYEEKTKIYYLYIASKETEYNKKRLDLIRLLFWTIGRKLNVIWNYHYGIVGCDNTMKINYIQII